MNAYTLSVTSVHRLHSKTGLKEFGSGCLLLLFFSISAFADTHYVSLSGSHIAPFTDWMTAATNIQAAIDVTEAGDTVLVTNGLYAVGGTFVADVTNRVAITNAVTVQSVNGSGATTIQGQGPMGAAAVRCVYVADGAKLIGFTLTNGFTHVLAGSSGSGGGIYCDSTAGLISNCTLTGNLAGWNGGGAYGGALYNCVITGNSASCGGGASDGTLYNCVITGNLAHGFRAMGGGGTYNGTLYNCILTGNTSTYGGGTCGGTLYNCTLTGNSASYSGGGASYGTLYNSIVYYNTASSDSNWLSCTLYYSCTTPDPEGMGNITAEPLFVNTNGDYHLASGSPCIDAGNNASGGGSDLDGRSRTVGSAVDMGCYEASQVHSGNSKVHYVSPSGGNVWPYTNWITAATIVQHAVDAANAGDMVLVTNGVYAMTGAFAAGLTNRVAITKAVTVQSVNGPDVTIIQGQGPMGAAAVRCAYVVDGASIVGFTLTNGFTQVSSGSSGSGGGVYCDPTAGMISNCILTGNSANFEGGGAYNGQLYNCTLTGNSANYYGGGAYRSMLYNCTLTGNLARGYRWMGGGGAYGSTLYNCTLTGNSSSFGGGACDGALYSCTLAGNSAASGGGVYNGTLDNCTLTRNSANYGGGAENGTLDNCVLTGNSASTSGGGASGGTLYNCTLTGNSASYSGGGAYYGTLNNCIVYYNDAALGANYYNSIFNYSCTTPHPGGLGNITSEPQLASFSHLAVGSPCQGAGHTNYARGTDIDGEAWRAPPSMGCDEVATGAITGALSVSAWAASTNAAVGFPIQFRADIVGRTTWSVWDFGDGIVLSNRPYAMHAYASPGVYVVLLQAHNESYPQGITATVTVQVAVQAIHYVNLNNAMPIAPYLSWATAATNIQDALDAADQIGALVLVSNGTYATGVRVVYGALSNRVAITKPVTVRSVNGPAKTIIQGAGPMGESAVRCVYVGTNAVLVGFTLTNGATRSNSNLDCEGCGGGVWCESSGVLSNCVLTGNLASYSGGGASGGTLNNCTLTGNSASYGGGGAYYGTLYNCTLTENSASYGGGVSARYALQLYRLLQYRSE